MRNAQTIKLLHRWAPSNLDTQGRTTVLVDPKTYCTRCGEPLTRANRWFACPGKQADPDWRYDPEHAKASR